MKIKLPFINPCPAKGTPNSRFRDGNRRSSRSIREARINNVVLGIGTEVLYTFIIMLAAFLVCLALSFH